MKFIYGRVLPSIPNEFTPPEVWPEYGHIADPVPVCRRELLEEDPVAIRWSVWPLTFEEYWGDAEPNVAKSSGGVLARNRFVMWRRLHDSTTPPGWRRSGPQPLRIDGYQQLSGADFVARWHKNARREVRLWLENHYNKTHTIEEISFDEYQDAYKQSLVAKREGIDRLHFMARKVAVPLAAKHIKILGVRNMATGRIVAGTGIVFSPRYKSSTHLVPFIHEEARRIYAATGLVHYWFETSRQMGCPNVLTTNFWHPGKPNSWKGFSLFKSRFGWEYVAYPPALWRFVRGKLW